MIKHVVLRNWRAYDALDLTFDNRATFVVAENGIGKTSLVKGVQWALFGDVTGIDPREEMRENTDETEASVELVLPDGRTLEVTRTFGERTRVRGHIDDMQLTASSHVEDVLTETFDVNAALLARLCVVPEQGIRRSPDEGDLLRAHLADVFGVEKLEAAADEAHTVALQAGRTTREIRDLEILEEADRESTERAVAEASEKADQLQDDISQLNRSAADLKEQLDRHEQWDQHRRRLDEYRTSLDQLVEQTAGLLERDVTRTDALDALGDAEEQILQRRDARRTESAELQGREQAIQEHLSALDDAKAECPVCTRPLDETTRQQAAATHRQRLEEIREQRRQLEFDRDDDSTLDRVRSLQRELRGLTEPQPPERDRPESDRQELTNQLRETREATEQKSSELATVREQLRLAKQRLDEDDSVRQARQRLVRAYRREALADASEEAFRAAAEEIVSRQIEPLERALRERWKRLMGARSGALGWRSGNPVLRTDAGEREARQLSGAEQTIAFLLTRMLVMTAFTKARFLWLDEPLEHLDPHYRRAAAYTLLGAVERGELDQVVVTTYEEPLVRKLAAARDLADIEYVAGGR